MDQRSIRTDPIQVNNKEIRMLTFQLDLIIYDGDKYLHRTHKGQFSV